GPKIGTVRRQAHGWLNAIEKYEHAGVARAEEPHPTAQAVDVFLRGPVFPGVARPIRRSARKLPALHIDQEPRPAGAEHDEIEILDRRIAPGSAFGFIDGDVAKILRLQIRLERGFVGIAAVHGIATLVRTRAPARDAKIPSLAIGLRSILEWLSKLRPM